MEGKCSVMGAGARARGVARGAAPRGVCLRVPTARPRSTRRGRGAPQQATCAKRADARQGRGRLHERFGRTARPSRGDADEEGGVGPGGAGDGASRHREAAAGATRGAARVAVSKRQLTARLCACEATCAKRAGLTRWGKTCAKHPSPGSTRRPSPPPPPATSARARAGGPRHLRAARCRRPTS